MRDVTGFAALIVTPTLAVASVTLADLPQSLNFENQSATRVHSTQGESTLNEKEVEFGDLDNDGDPDLVIAVGSSDFGERKNKLYLNSGGVFDEMSGTTLIPEFAQDDVSRNAFIRDYTGDGWPDIYIINDSNSGGFAGTDKLYVAEHAGGLLTGYSEEGATRIASGGALGAACSGVSYDFDGDGDMDVYSGNYPGPSQDVGLYNNGSGTLPNVTTTMIPSDGNYTVDVALGDMNGDGKMDILVSNHSPNFIYYNDNNGGGSGLGDYRYANSSQNLGTSSGSENAMEAADFDNDGDMDILWTNRSGSTGDRILRNDGNNASNIATFATLDILPSWPKSTISRKTTVADFNEDGRLDAFIGTENATRPTVIRNTTVNGVMSFVDWTPAPAFPNNSLLRGWHGAAFDTGADGDVDLLIGGFLGDHLLENVPAREMTEAETGGVLAFFDTNPLAVLGTAADGEVDAYAANNLSNGFVSVVLNGPDDYLLEVLDGGGGVVASSDRGGLGVEEAFQMTSDRGNFTVRVTVLESASAGCAPPDLDGDCVVGFSDLLELLANWGCTGCPADIDGGGAGFSDLLLMLSGWGPVDAANEYLLEVLGRTG